MNEWECVVFVGRSSFYRLQLYDILELLTCLGFQHWLVSQREMTLNLHSKCGNFISGVTLIENFEKNLLYDWYLRNKNCLRHKMASRYEFYFRHLQQARVK